MTDHRTEAAPSYLTVGGLTFLANLLECSPSRETLHAIAKVLREDAEQLAADREQGIVRVKLDEELADRIAQASHDAECDCGEAVADTEPVKEAVLAALREAAQ